MPLGGSLILVWTCLHGSYLYYFWPYFILRPQLWLLLFNEWGPVKLHWPYSVGLIMGHRTFSQRLRHAAGSLRPGLSVLASPTLSHTQHVSGKPRVHAPTWRFYWLLSPICQFGFEFGELWLRDDWYPAVKSRCCFCWLTSALLEVNASSSPCASSDPHSVPRERGDSKPLSGTTRENQFSEPLLSCLPSPLLQLFGKFLWKILVKCSGGFYRTEPCGLLSHHHPHLHHLHCKDQIFIIILGGFLLDGN